VITQNIDGLHGRAGTRKLVEVHGTIAHSSCSVCSASYPLPEVRGRQAADARGVPRCGCGAPLKPDVVLFGESLPMGALERAQRLADEAGLAGGGTFLGAARTVVAMSSVAASTDELRIIRFPSRWSAGWRLVHLEAG